LPVLVGWLFGRAATATGVRKLDTWVASRTSPAYAAVSSAYLISRKLRRDSSGNVTAQYNAVRGRGMIFGRERWWKDAEI
jgi:hypothetical protein